MLIPSPDQVRQAITAIPKGSTMTLKAIRDELAEESGAGTTCPFVAGIFWKLIAEAADENLADGIDDRTPWWRVTKDGKPNPKLPGGIDRHRALLVEEGVRI